MVATVYVFTTGTALKFVLYSNQNRCGSKEMPDFIKPQTSSLSHSGSGSEDSRGTHLALMYVDAIGLYRPHLVEAHPLLVNAR